MIVKLDHICFASHPSPGLESVLELFSHYRQRFVHKNIPNLAIKAPFRSFTDEFHDIIFLENPKSFPIEITAYPRLTRNVPILTFDWVKNHLQITSTDIEKTAQFLSAFGFRNTVGGLSFKAPLDSMTLTVEITRSKQITKWTLDNEGFCCIAFQVSNMQRELKRIGELGFFCTEFSRLTVDNSDFNICFVQGHCGEVIELIQYNR